MESFIVHEFGLFLPITFEARSVYAFIDLGANPGSVSPSIASQYQITGKSVNRAAFSERESPLVTVPEFTLLGRSFKNVELNVSHSENFSRLDLSVPFHIGARELLSEPLILDFHRLTAEFKSNHVFPESVKIQTRQSHSLILFTLTVQGKKIQAVFDTGAGVSVFNTAHTEDLDLNFAWSYDTDAEDPNGIHSQMSMYSLTDLKIQDVVLGSTEVAHINLSSIEQALGTRVDLLFGVNTMIKSGLTWLIDREQQILRVSRH